MLSEKLTAKETGDAREQKTSLKTANKTLLHNNIIKEHFRI